MKRKPAKLQALCLAAALLAPALLLPTVASARSSDRNQPMDADADRSDCNVGNDGAPCLLIGNVVVTQGTLVINAAKADIKRSNGDISYVTLTGSQVTMKQELDDGSPFNGRANKVDYDMPKEIVIFTGNAYVDKAGDTIKSERIVYNMKTGQVESGGTGGRVSVRLQPKSGAAPAPAAPNKPAAKPAPKPAPAKKGGG